LVKNYSKPQSTKAIGLKSKLAIFYSKRSNGRNETFSKKKSILKSSRSSSKVKLKLKLPSSKQEIKAVGRNITLTATDEPCKMTPSNIHQSTET